MNPMNERMKDEEKGKEEDDEEGDSLSSEKRLKLDTTSFPLTRLELMAVVGFLLFFSSSLLCFYFTMPSTGYAKLKLPRSLSDLRLLKEHLAIFAKDCSVQFILGYCSMYIFMHTFLIPGKIFMALLAGALFGVVKGLLLVVFNATAGASSCFFLSKLIGKPIVHWWWPEKLRFFQEQIAKRRGKLLNYMLFLRITPTLPGSFINLASPIVDIPFHIFFFATLFGLIPGSYIIAQAGLALGDLKSASDLYDFKTLSLLFLIGFLAIFPTLLKRANI